MAAGIDERFVKAQRILEAGHLSPPSLVVTDATRSPAIVEAQRGLLPRRRVISQQTGIGFCEKAPVLRFE